jgi:hypothetical protein
MHTLSTAFVLGYHGCDSDVAEYILAGNDFKASMNDYDWLGPGIYFWESNPVRGLEFAKELQSNPRGSRRIKKPTVIGAVIDMGLCLDLTTSSGANQVRIAHDKLAQLITAAKAQMPVNSKDLLRRNLDCAVIRTLHEIRKSAGEDEIDTIKGIFLEGEPIYPSAGFHEKTHSQICVRNLSCIKGVFRVPKSQL